MFPIGRMHQDLVIPRESIHEAEHLMTGGGVDQQIYAREGVTVFRTCSVQVRVVDTKPPFAIVFSDEDHIGQPPRIVHIFDELGLEEFVNFGGYKGVALRMEMRCFWRWGRKWGSMLRRWVMKEGSMPGMPEWVQANTSLCSVKRAVRSALAWAGN